MYGIKASKEAEQERWVLNVKTRYGVMIEESTLPAQAGGCPAWKKPSWRAAGGECWGESALQPPKQSSWLFPEAHSGHLWGS